MGQCRSGDTGAGVEEFDGEYWAGVGELVS